jgi:hypothetical protein
MKLHVIKYTLRLLYNLTMIKESEEERNRFRFVRKVKEHIILERP